MTTLQVPGVGEVEFTADLRVKCHVCGCDVDIGHQGNGEPALLHAVPECKAYGELDMLDYLTQMRKYYERGGQWAS